MEERSVSIFVINLEDIPPKLWLHLHVLVMFEGRRSQFDILSSLSLSGYPTVKLFCGLGAVTFFGLFC